MSPSAALWLTIQLYGTEVRFSCTKKYLLSHVQSKKKHRCGLEFTPSAFRIWLSERAETCSLHLPHGHRDDKPNPGRTETGREVASRVHLRSNRKDGKMSAVHQIGKIHRQTQHRWSRSGEVGLHGEFLTLWWKREGKEEAKMTTQVQCKHQYCNIRGARILANKGYITLIALEMAF